MNNSSLPLTWLTENPTAREVYSPGHKHARRSHTKSRRGCRNCKRRKIKCDEFKPACRQCDHHRIRCDFIGTSQALPSIPGTEGSMVLRSFSTEVVQILESGGAHRAPVHGRQNPYIMVELLSHYESVSWSSLGPPLAQRMMRTMVPSLSQESPFLLHSIIAFAARHLQHLVPQDPTYQIAATHHQDHALRLYSKQLSQAINPEKVDALLATCMILTGLAFLADTGSSCILADPQDVYRWIAVTSGLGVLLRLEIMKPHLPRSLWLPVIRDSDDDQDTFTNIRPGLEGLPTKFARLCNITSASDKDNNPYHIPLRLLAAMMSLPSGVQNFTKLIAFPCRLPSNFVSLIPKRDSVALLLMSYWFAMMCTMPHWWCVERARFECRAICQHLKDTEDDRVQELLSFPARACGHPAMRSE